MANAFRVFNHLTLNVILFKATFSNNIHIFSTHNLSIKILVGPTNNLKNLLQLLIFLLQVDSLLSTISSGLVYFRINYYSLGDFNRFVNS